MKFGKVVLFGCGGFLVISIIMVVSWFSFVGSAIDGMGEAANVKLKETIRIEELPLLKGIVVTDSQYAAPFSGDSAALCVLKVGVRITYTGRVRSHNRAPRPKWAFDHINTVVPNPSAFIKIGDKTYPVDFKDAIFKGIAVQHDHRFDDATFATNSYSDYYDTLHELSDIDEALKKPVSAEKKQFLKNLKALKNLYGLNRHIDKFANTALKQQPLYDPINIEEILYRNGDSIKLKGRIENGRIVPLF